MKNLKHYIFILAMIATLGLSAQVSINTNGADPDGSAMLDVQSTDKGMLIPRMTTTQRTAIAAPATGLLVFDNETGSFWFYNGTEWQNIGSSSQTLLDVLSNGNNGGGMNMDNIGNLTADRVYIEHGDTPIIKFVQTDELGEEPYTWDMGGSTAFFIRDVTGGSNQPFRIKQGSAWDRIVIGGNNVGIGGIFTPTETLDVDGKIRMREGAAAGFIPVSDNLGVMTWTDPSVIINANQNLIKDTDNDTKIQVEESPDEDKIRFDMAGTEQFVMDGPRLEVLNSGNSVFIGEGAGESDDLSNNQNVFIGKNAGSNNTTGNANTAIGIESMQNNSNGSYNTAIGADAMFGNNSITGNSNSAVGNGAMYYLSTGQSNSAFGSNSMGYNSSGNDNSAFGYLSLYNNVFGSSNTAIGRSSLYFNNGSNNVAIGVNAGFENDGNANIFLGYEAGANATGSNKLYISNHATNSPLIYGDFASDALTVNGSLRINDGTQSTGYVLTSDANGNATWQTSFSGDNLGNHTALQTLDMAGNDIVNADTVTATAFVGDGSGLTNLPTSGWELTGNTGTDTTINFIGTTDDMPLDFKVNNQRVMRYQNAPYSPNIIGGYTGNSITGGVFASTIAGGGEAGDVQSITSNYGFIGGGRANLVSGIFGVIGGGSSNNVSGSRAIVGGGGGNIASGSYSTVVGGLDNQASGSYNSVGGGVQNISSGLYSSVGGGFSNNASGSSSTVPGGNLNSAAGDYSFAAGRRANIDAAHDGSFLFADQNNKDFNSSAANEFAIRATGGVRFVTAIDGTGIPTQTISMDNTGTVTAAAFVGDGSGLTNLPVNSWSLTGNAGTDTTTHFIGTIDDMPLDFKVNNQRALRISPAATSPNITGGYFENVIADGVQGAVIAGGGTDLAQKNTITADYGVISGGIKNTVSGSLSAVSGGSFHTASGNLSAIGGGFNNTASGIVATIAGGESNTASGNHSTVAGGIYNQAGGDYSLAAGRRAKIDPAHDGSFLFADQNNYDFNSAAINEFAVRATGGVRFVTAIDGSGNPTQTVSIDNTGSLEFTDGTALSTASGIYTVSNGDFVPRSGATGFVGISSTYANGLGGTYITTSGSTVSLLAPVHLPQGATVTKVTIYGNDESASLNLKTSLYFTTYLNAGAGTMVTHTSNTSSGAYTSVHTSIGTPIIDNSIQNYYIQVDVIGGGWPSTWGELAIDAVVIEWEMQ
ncbi:MAG TPA: hypothetical protein P5514_02855 [Bacteroidales bacterium]|nr:hypothetical protein [Bacteroidales bacterium]